MRAFTRLLTQLVQKGAFAHSRATNPWHATEDVLLKLRDEVSLLGKSGTKNVYCNSEIDVCEPVCLLLSMIRARCGTAGGRS